MVCQWTRTIDDWSDDNTWNTECGTMWTMNNDDGLEKNGMGYCPRCGRLIVEVIVEE